MAETPTALARLEALAREQGWRLEWSRSTWNLNGFEVVGLDIFAKGVRIGGGCGMGRGSDDPNFSGERVAALILEGLDPGGNDNADDRRSALS